MPIPNTIVRPQQRQHLLGQLIYSQSPLVRLMLRATAVLGIALGLACLRMALESLRPDVAFRKDFLQEYVLTRAMADGIDPYLPVETLARRYLGSLPHLVHPHPTPHPPTVGLLLMPLSRLDYSTAAAVWFGFELVCLVAAVHLLGRVARVRLSIWTTLAVATTLMIWYPFPVELVYGQLMLLMLALLTGAWVAVRSDRSVLGGVLLGLTMLIKPVSLVLLLLLLFSRDWHALVGAALVVLSGYAVAGCVIGLESMVTYLTEVLPLVAYGYRAYARNISISTLGWRVFDGTGSEVALGLQAPPLLQYRPAAHITSLVLPLAVLLVASLRVRNQPRSAMSWALMTSVAILTSPISWSHYLVLAAIPVTHVVRWLVHYRLPSRATNLALVVAIMLVPDWYSLAGSLAGPRVGVEEQVTVSFALALLTVMPTAAVGALAWLVSWLGPIGIEVTGAQARCGDPGRLEERQSYACSEGY